MTATRPTISFDLDGTVIVNAFNAGVAPRLRDNLRGAPGLAHLAADKADETVTAAVTQVFRGRIASGRYVDAYDWDSIYAEVCERFGGSPLDVRSLYREMTQMEGLLRLMPGAREGLEQLRQTGFELVVVTNGHHCYQWPVLEAVGIADLFTHVITPDRSGYAKPDPRIFESVPGLVAHVGDTLLADIAGANLAGLTSVMLLDPMPEHLVALSAEERPRTDRFATYLKESLTRLPLRDHYPHATLEMCLPDAVVASMPEAAEVLVSRFARQEVTG